MQTHRAGNGNSAIDGTTIPNAVISKVGTNGAVCLFTSAPTDLLADVNGSFGPVTASDPPVAGSTGSTTSNIPAGGGEATGLGVSVVTGSTAPETLVTIESFSSVADMTSVGADARKITLNQAVGPITLSIPADGGATNLADEQLSLLVYNAETDQWEETPADIASLRGERVLQFSVTPPLPVERANANIRIEGFPNPFSVIARVTEDLGSFLDRNVFSKIVQFAGIRTTPPVCTNPVAEKVAASANNALDMFLGCVEQVGDFYRIKIKNNRSIAFLVSYGDGAAYSGMWKSSDWVKDAIVDATQGRVIFPGSEVWISVPVGSQGTIHVYTDWRVSSVAMVLEQLFDELKGYVGDAFSLDGQMAYDLASCAVDLSRVGTDISTDMNAGAVSSIFSCVEGVIDTGIRTGHFIRDTQGQFVKNWGKAADVKKLAAGINSAIHKFTILKTFTFGVLDMMEGVASPDFEIRLGEVGLKITNDVLPRGTIGVEYFAALQAENGMSTSFNWLALGLPAGLSMSNEGLITGTPTATTPATGVNVFVSATDPMSGQYASRNVNIAIDESSYPGHVVKIAGRVDSYYVDNRSGWHPIPDGGVYECLIAQGKSLVDNVAASVLTRVTIYPNEPAKCIRADEGNIVVHSDGDSYLVQNGALRPIVDVPTYECLSRENRTVVQGITRYWVLDMPRGDDISASCWDPVAVRGSIVTDDAGHSFYVDLRGGNHKIPNGGVFDCINQQGKPVFRNYRASEIAQLGVPFEDAECVRVNPGDILEHHQDPDSYVIQDGFTKRWIPNGTAFNCQQARNRNIVAAPRYYISDLVSAADLTVTESCHFMARNPANGEVWLINDGGTRQMVADGWSLGCFQAYGWPYIDGVPGDKISPVADAGGRAVCALQSHFLSRVIQVSEPNGSLTSYVVTGDARLYWIATTQGYSCIRSRLGYGEITGMTRATFDQGVNQGSVAYKGEARCFDSAQGVVSNIGAWGINLFRASDGTPWVLQADGAVQYIPDWEEGYACVRNYLVGNGLLHSEQTGVVRGQVDQSRRIGDWDCWSPGLAANKIVRNYFDGNSYWTYGGNRWYINTTQFFNCFGGMGNTYNVGSYAGINANYPEYAPGAAVAACAGHRFANDRLYDCGAVNGSWVVDWYGTRHNVLTTTAYYGWKAHMTGLYGADGMRTDCDVDFWAIRTGGGWNGP